MSTSYQAVVICGVTIDAAIENMPVRRFNEITGEPYLKDYRILTYRLFKNGPLIIGDDLPQDLSLHMSGWDDSDIRYVQIDRPRYLGRQLHTNSIDQHRLPREETIKQISIRVHQAILSKYNVELTPALYVMLRVY